uniref:Uncharacterized protein n=1 Tax=Cacopsylla melanoneura TaxID=428564 RepID=A0A8D9BR73_9HEMI
MPDTFSSEALSGIYARQFRTLFSSKALSGIYAGHFFIQGPVSGIYARQFFLKLPVLHICRTLFSKISLSCVYAGHLNYTLSSSGNITETRVAHKVLKGNNWNRPNNECHFIMF